MNEQLIEKWNGMIFSDRLTAFQKFRPCYFVNKMLNGENCAPEVKGTIKNFCSLDFAKMSQEEQKRVVEILSV